MMDDYLGELVDREENDLKEDGIRFRLGEGFKLLNSVFKSKIKINSECFLY